MHKSYREVTKREPDFLVRYRFFKPEEGGRQHLPFQGIRSDFWYPHPLHKPGNIFTIRPEFLDKDGQIILDNQSPVPESGFAEMWILVRENLPYHREKLVVGTIGYFMEGPHRTVECTVLKMMGELLITTSWTINENL